MVKKLATTHYRHCEAPKEPKQSILSPIGAIWYRLLRRGPGQKARTPSRNDGIWRGERLRALVLTLFLILGGCNAPPQNWSSPDTNDVTTSVFIQAANNQWTQGPSYIPKYQYTITVKAKAPGFDASAATNEATTTGTIRFADWASCPTCTAINGIPPFSTYGAVEYKISSVQPDSGRGTIISILHNDGYPTATLDKASANKDDQYIWLRVVDDLDAYGDNIGQYEVLITAPEPNTTFIGKVADFIITPIQKQIAAVADQFWTNIVSSQVTSNIIHTLLILYIVILGIYFIFGFVEITQKELVSRLIKIAIVYALIFNTNSQDFFKEYLFDLFTKGQVYLINAVVAPAQNDPISQQDQVNFDNAFGFANGIFTTIFSSQFLTILVSFILWFPVGWICFCLLLLGMIEYTIAVIEALIFYLIATTTVQFLICLGPIFICLLLFEKTRELFETWIKLIIAFVMQPIILFATIILISTLIGGAVNELMNIQLGWSCVIPLYINFGAGIKVPLGCIHWYTPTIASFLDVITTCLIFYLLIRLITKVTKISEKITEKLFGQKGATEKGSQMASGVGKSIRGSLSDKNQNATPAKSDDKKSRATIDTKDKDSTAMIEGAPKTSRISDGIKAGGKMLQTAAKVPGGIAAPTESTSTAASATGTAQVSPKSDSADKRPST